MKFAEHLTAHITPEWRKQYINYEEMKAMLYVAVEEAPSAESVEEEIRRRHYANFDESFFHYCDQELKKINTFYSGERDRTRNLIRIKIIVLHRKTKPVWRLLMEITVCRSVVTGYDHKTNTSISMLAHLEIH